MACDPFVCQCCKSACCCSRTGSLGTHECCQGFCADCEQAHGEGAAPGENCSSDAIDGCDSAAMVERLPFGFCCEQTTDECLEITTECECLRENGGYTDPCTGSVIPDSGEDWAWTIKTNCGQPGVTCCPCNAVCCLGEGDECCDIATSLCCRGALGQTCCDGVCCESGEVCCDGICCEAGQTCVDGVCQEGCVQDADCQPHFFDCGGVTYGPYEGAVNCAAAAAAICPGPPAASCYAGPLEEKYCCGGTCQDTPCQEGQFLLPAVRLPKVGLSVPWRKSRRWRKLFQRALSLPRPWHGPGSCLKFLLSLMGINASPTCGCNKKASEMDERGSLWSIRHSRDIVAFMSAEAQKRKLPFPPRVALAMVIASAVAAAIMLPIRPRRDTGK